MKWRVSIVVLAFALSAIVNVTLAQRPVPTPYGPLIKLLKTPDRVQAVEYSPDGGLLAAGFGWNSQGGVRIWRTSDHTVVANLDVGDGDDGNIERISFSNDGQLFAAAAWSGDVFIWKVGSWTTLKKVLSEQEEAESLNFSPDSKSLLLATENLVVVYDLTSGKQRILARKGGNTSIVSAQFSSDGKSVIVCEDGSIRILNFADGKEIKKLAPADVSFFGTVTKNGQFLVSGGGAIYGSKSVEVRRMTDGNKISEISGFRSGLFALAISATGEKFAVAGGDYGGGGDLSLWGTQAAREIGFASFGDMPIQALAFSPNEKTLAAGSDNGYVLLYEVDRIKGPEVEKQTFALCGEIVRENDTLFVVPLSKVPGVQSQEFRYNWKLEISNVESVKIMGRSAVALDEWAIERSSANDKIRVDRLRALGPTVRENSDHIVFGDVQNPGWNKGFITKVYFDGTFVTTDNPGRCIATGSIARSGFDFAGVKKRLIDVGILSVPKEPLTLGAAHFRTKFIELTVNGQQELRTDAEDIGLLLKGGQAKKRNAFEKIISRVEAFITSLRTSSPANTAQ